MPQPQTSDALTRDEAARRLTELADKWCEMSRTECFGFVQDGCPSEDLRPGYAVQLVQCANELKAEIAFLYGPPVETPTPEGEKP